MPLTNKVVHVRIFIKIVVSKNSPILLVEGFCAGDGGILHKEESISRIWKAFCI